MWSKRPDCQHLITGQSTVNQQLAVLTLNFTDPKILQTSCNVQSAQDAASWKHFLVSLVSTHCVPFSKNAFYECIIVPWVNALIICLPQNTRVLMKVLNCKTKFKPITTERQFHNTSSWHGASAGNTGLACWLKSPISNMESVGAFSGEPKREKKFVSLFHYYTIFQVNQSFGISKFHLVCLKKIQSKLSWWVMDESHQHLYPYHVINFLFIFTRLAVAKHIQFAKSKNIFF